MITIYANQYGQAYPVIDGQPPSASKWLLGLNPSRGYTLKGLERILRKQGVEYQVEVRA